MITPQIFVPDLALALHLHTDLWLKREDLHAYGSHKGRSIPAMMDVYRSRGVHTFVISSSGNAARAAISALEPHESLTIFVGKNIDREKRRHLSLIVPTPPRVTIHDVERPKQTAFLFAKKHGAVNLRQSTDDIALLGYESLAKELDEIPHLQAIFVPTSSGTTAQALGTYLPHVQIHIVQTEAVHPIAATFDKNFIEKNRSEARAIVDTVAHRKHSIIEIIKKTGGSGWIVADEEIFLAMRLAEKTVDTSISPNSALSLAGVDKALRSGWNFSGPVVCILTGP